MHPILFRIGQFEIYSYGVLMALSFYISLYPLLKDSRHEQAGGKTGIDSISDLLTFNPEQFINRHLAFEEIDHENFIRWFFPKTNQDSRRAYYAFCRVQAFKDPSFFNKHGVEDLDLFNDILRKREPWLILNSQILKYVF